MLKKILNEFMRIAAVPRPSHHEERIAEYLCRWAETHNLCYAVDGIGNVIIEKAAAPGYEKAPRVILQAHMDGLRGRRGRSLRSYEGRDQGRK